EEDILEEGGTMKKLLELGNDYAANSDWTDFALVKFCLCAMGILIGIGIPVKKKKMICKEQWGM
ncbi:MAG: hypothetical protein ACI4E3_07375, partial [Candidatus Fimousia sp.]